MAEDKNPANIDGRTPLHIAARCGLINICKLIVENTKDKNPADIFGTTPMDFANGNKEMMELFRDYTILENELRFWGILLVGNIIKEILSQLSF